jgi:CHAT domain-containing protein/tetratricopeptide (TPR) repeat protein
MPYRPFLPRLGLTIFSATIAWLTLPSTATAQPQPSEPVKPAAEEPPWRRVLTGSDARRVAELTKQIDELEAAGKLTEAQTPAQEIVVIRTRVQGAMHWQTADASRRVATLARISRLSAEEKADLAAAGKLQREGEVLREQGRYAQAETHFRKVLAIHARILGEKHPLTAQSCNWVFLSLKAQGKYRDAEPLARRALTIHQQVLGDEHPDTAISYNNLAASLSDQGKYVEANRMFRQGLAICRKVLGEEHYLTAISYNNLADNLKSQGNYTDAEPLFRKALVILQKLLGDEHLNTVPLYSNLAGVLAYQNKPAEAEVLCRKSLVICRKVLGDEHPDTARCYQQMAGILGAQDKFAEAESLSRRALAIHRRLGEEHPDTATSYLMLGSELLRQRKAAEAEPLLRKALTIRCKVLGEEHPHTVVGYDDLANCLDEQGKHAEAELLFRKTLRLSCKILGEEHLYTANSYYSLGSNLNLQGNYPEAERLYRQALAITRKASGEESLNTAICYNSLAFNLSCQGHYAEAETMGRAAAKSFEAARLRISFVGLERVATAAERSPLPRLASCLARAGKASDAWHSWEADLSRGLLDDLSGRQARPMTEEERGRAKELAVRLQAFEKPIAALMQLRDPTDAQRQQRDKLHQQRDAVLAELAKFEAELAQHYGPVAGQVYDLGHIQAQLPADAALLSWLDLKGQPKAVDPNGEHWACIVRKRGAPLWVKLTGSGPKGSWTEDDDQLPEEVYQLLVKQPTDVTVPWRERTGQLYTQRLAPLAKSLGAREGLPTVRHLIILPSQLMAGLSVEALIEARTDKQPGYTVSYAPSGTMFAWLQERRKVVQARDQKPDHPRLLALGDPAFATSFPRLAGSRREVEAIARLFDNPDRLLGSRASEQQLEQFAASGRLQDYRYIHLATHGVLDSKSAMQSALILAQDALPDPLQQVLAGKKVYDGRLTAAQILRTWKLDAELVTLSACQSGLGKFERGEGYLGFAQALFVAGSRSLVLSQWSVDDRATALLMTRFYQNLLGKRKGLDKPMSKAEALRDAKEWLRGLKEKEGGERLAELPRGEERERPLGVPGTIYPYAHPYYWAAFILIGDPN